VLGFALNKALIPSIWTLPALALYCDVMWSPMMYPANPPRWWYSEGIKADKGFFSKQSFLSSCDGVRQALFPLASHGGSERGRDLATLSSEGVDWGRSNHIGLINTDGFYAAANLCQNGSDITTSNGEAFLRPSRGCSNPLHHEVIHSPWRRGGLWLKIDAGRGLPSIWLLLLDGDASRTPACGGGSAKRPTCKNTFCSRMLFVIEAAVSLDRAFLGLEWKRLFL
jgi:hypothetical protein